MRLAELIEHLPVTLRLGSPEVEITAVTEDSRLVAAGALFVARPGMVTDGRKFIPQAVAAGAAAILADDASGIDPSPAALLTCDEVPLQAAILAERFHGDPSKRLTLIGVTGTNGKTTVVSLAHQLLNRSGIRCGLIGTVHVDAGRGIHRAALTTPPAVEISRLLRFMVDHGCRACVIEASSHALDQRRTAGLAFAAGVFTNLSGDHLDYHKTMEAYGGAKARLFRAVGEGGWAVVNADDPASEKILSGFDGRVITTSFTDEKATCFAEVGMLSSSATQARMAGPWGEFMVRLPIVGRHNVANALQAAAVAHRLGVNGDALAEGLSQCAAPPGRLEPVTGELDEITVLVDYAHTDDALDNVLCAVRPLVPEQARLVVVFGCGGDRDATKRPRMAGAACRWADEIIVTSDNPRTEDPRAIIDEILGGIPSDRRQGVLAIVDRAQAIHTAVARAEAGDVILIAGKGHETHQIIGAARRPFDDRTVAAQAILQRRARVEAV